MKLLQGIKLLEEAYIEGNWESVRDAYELISGEKLQTNKDVPNLVESLSPKLNKLKIRGKRKNDPISDEVASEPKKRGRPPKSIAVSNPQPKVEQKVEKDNSEKIQARTEPIRAGKNLFVDDGTLALEDKIIDKKLRRGKGGKGWKKPPPRPGHQFIEQECSSKGCSNIVQIAPELYLSDTSYLCNKCLGKKR